MRTGARVHANSHWRSCRQAFSHPNRYSRAYGTWLTPPTVGMRQGKYVVDVPAECAHGTADCGCAAAAQATSLANIDAVLSPERWASPLAGAYRACIDRQLADNVDRIGACLIEVGWWHACTPGAARLV